MAPHASSSILLRQAAGACQHASCRPQRLWLSASKRFQSASTSSTVAPAGTSWPRYANTLIASTAAAVVGYAAAVAYPTPLARILNPPNAPPSALADSPEGKRISAGIEQELQGLAIVKALREELLANADSLPADTPISAKKRWVESRPYVHYNPEKRVHR